MKYQILAALVSVLTLGDQLRVVDPDGLTLLVVWRVRGRANLRRVP
jgi:hypothetical protein